MKNKIILTILFSLFLSDIQITWSASSEIPWYEYSLSLQHRMWLGGIIFIVILIFFFKHYFSEEEKNSRKWKKNDKREKIKINRLKQEKEEKHIQVEKEKIKREQLEQIKQVKEAEYQRYLSLRKQIEEMPIYQRWRQDVIKRCGNKCQICGCSQNLQVHHRVSVYKILKYCKVNSIERAFECKPLWDVDNGEVLCKECHDKMESSQKRISLNNENEL